MKVEILQSLPDKYFTRTFFVEIGGSWQWRPQLMRGEMVTVFIWLWVAVGIMRVSIPSLSILADAEWKRTKPAPGGWG